MLVHSGSSQIQNISAPVRVTWVQLDTFGCHLLPRRWLSCRSVLSAYTFPKLYLQWAKLTTAMQTRLNIHKCYHDNWYTCNCKCRDFYDVWKKDSVCSDTIGLIYTSWNIVQVLGYQILNYCSQCSQETVMVIVECLSLHDQIRTQGIVRYGDFGMSVTAWPNRHRVLSAMVILECLSLGYKVSRGTGIWDQLVL